MTRLTLAPGRAHWSRTGRLASGRGLLLKGKHHVFDDFVCADDINAGPGCDCSGLVGTFTSRVAGKETFQHAVYYLIAGRNGRIDPEISVYDAIEPEASAGRGHHFGKYAQKLRESRVAPSQKIHELDPIGGRVADPAQLAFFLNQNGRVVCDRDAP